MHPRHTRATLVAALALSTAGFVALPGLTAAANAAAPTTPYISEIHYDNNGTDAGEFVEVLLPAGTSSAGLSIVLYNGNGGATYDTDALPVMTAPADAPAVAVVDYPSNGLQNGGADTGGDTDGIALVKDGTVLEFLSYEGAFVATNGPASGTTSTDIGVSEPSTTPAGESLSRTYDADTDALVWSGPAANSKGAVNPTGTTPPPAGSPCEDTPTHEIGEVQGEGPATTLPAGTPVTVTGVVVGDLPGLGGYYLQDADGDGNPATSDGIFVLDDLAVDLGDTVAVTGNPGEDFGQTQVNANAAGTASEVCDEGTEADLPAPAPLDLPAAASEREKREGMLVEPVDTLTVSEVFDLTSFGELTLSEGGLLVQPTELARPGAAADAIAVQNTLRRIVLDDGFNSRVSTTTRPYLTPTTPVRVGDELTFTEPLVLGYGFSQWRLQPADGTAEGVFTPQNTRPTAPEAVGGDIQVGAFNVLNYFITFGGEGRGAENQAQLDKQAGKIVPAIEALGADIVTLMEIEDTDSTGHTPGNADLALQDLVNRLNTAAGSDKWDFVPLPDELYAVDRDVIRNGIIYQPAVVQPVGDPVGLVDESVWFNAREPIAQTFTAQEDVFTVVANHFKSKGSGDAATGDNVDTGQGAWNGDRVRQAQSLRGFVDSLRADTGDQDVLMLGDFNAYTQEDPIEALRDGGFVDLGELFDAGRYSYVFDDMSGSLDHALATEPLADKVTDLTHWNINAVESFAYQYVGDPALYAANPFRSSDHDPLVLGLDLQAPPAPPTCGGLEATLVGTASDDVLQGTDGQDVIVAFDGSDRISGLGGPDVVCAGGSADIVKGGAGRDTVFGQTGGDHVMGGTAADELFGGRGDDTLLGQAGDDRLVGGPGDDVVEQGKR